VCILHKIGTTIFHFCGTQKRDPKGVAGTLFTMFLPLNARTIKAPPTRRKSKKRPHAANHGNVRNRLFINPKLYCTAPQTAHLVAMATCHLSWAINIFFLHGLTGYKSTLKRRRKFKLITLEQ
jgi:hypothetical protein